MRAKTYDLLAAPYRTDPASVVEPDNGGTQAQRLEAVLSMPVHRIADRLCVMSGNRPVLDVTDARILTAAQVEVLLEQAHRERFAPKTLPGPVTIAAPVPVVVVDAGPVMDETVCEPAPADDMFDDETPDWMREVTGAVGSQDAIDRLEHAKKFAPEAGL